jgi:hypothetical protein
MSLDTVLKIGNAFRKSNNGLKYFKYIKNCPIDTDKTTVLRLNLPVKEDFSFDFQNISVIDNENIIGSATVDSKLFYLDFKMSDSDSSPKKYLFGDVHFEVVEGKEIRYKSNLGDKESSFDNWNKFFEKVISEKLKEADKKIEKKINAKKDATDEIKEKELIEANAICKFQKSQLVSNFREAFDANKSKIENLLFYCLGLENSIKMDDFKVSILENVPEIEYLTAKKIFELNNADNAGKKRLAKILDIATDKIIWEEIENNPKHIESLIKSKSCNCFLHFDFSNTTLENKYWYEAKDELDFIYEIFIDAFAAKVQIKENDTVIEEKYVFNKTLYKTLCSGDSKNDIQFPSFSENKKYKSRAFSKDQVSDLFYAIDYASRGFMPTTDVKLIILPNGDNLDATDYDAFTKDFRNKREDAFVNRNNASDDLMFFVDENEEVTNDEKITTFDMIFTKKGSATSPDVDLIELSGVNKSSLKMIKQQIKVIGEEVFEKRKQDLFLIKNDLKPLSIFWAFSNILGVGQTDRQGNVSFKTNAKYQSHILKVLPKIYTANYVHDDLLLPRFIENTEYSVRQGDVKYSFLKYDFEFLFSIQNTNIYKSNFLKIMNSNSYKMGLLLGELARNFAGENSPIKSFEKNYVGNLSRRIGRIEDFILLKSDMEQKLIMHEKVNYTKKISSELAELINAHTGIYDKNECAFGFFESYFKTLKKKTLSDDLKSLITKHEGNKEQVETIQNLKNLLTLLEVEAQN